MDIMPCLWEQKIKRHGNLAGGIICIVNLEIVYFYLEILYFYVIGMLYLEVKVKINSDRLKERICIPVHAFNDETYTHER